jgi:hypothetical protein
MRDESLKELIDRRNAVAVNRDAVVAELERVDAELAEFDAEIMAEDERRITTMVNARSSQGSAIADTPT